MKVDNYGDLLSKVRGFPLLAYQEYGSYQGDYIAILDAGENIELWKGTYGSCSGCDWLEGEKNWTTGEVPDEIAAGYIGADHPFLVLPKSTARNLSRKALREILPANTRVDFERDYSDVKLDDLLKLIHEL